MCLCTQEHMHMHKCLCVYGQTHMHTYTFTCTCNQHTFPCVNLQLNTYSSVTRAPSVCCLSLILFLESWCQTENWRNITFLAIVKPRQHTPYCLPHTLEIFFYKEENKKHKSVPLPQEVTSRIPLLSQRIGSGLSRDVLVRPPRWPVSHAAGGSLKLQGEGSLLRSQSINSRKEINKKI